MISSWTPAEIAERLADRERAPALDDQRYGELVDDAIWQYLDSPYCEVDLPPDAWDMLRVLARQVYLGDAEGAGETGRALGRAILGEISLAARREIERRLYGAAG